MIPMTLGEIADRINGRLVLVEGASADDVIRGVSDTDSRNIGPGNIFFAKPGEATDGHLFAPKAVENGAALAVVERELALTIPQIVVEDVVLSLGQLATEVVERVRGLGRMRVIAVTGSNGKTTTKNLLKAIFERQGNVVAPIASFNNEVGAPTTFLQVNEETDTLIAEMGASKVGEIRYLTDMARPDIGIVLMVGLAHAGEFGGIDMIEKAKSEMIEALTEDGIAVLNADDPRVARMASKAPGEIVWFGRGEDAQVRATDVAVSQDGTTFTLHAPGNEPIEVVFPVIGEHHVMNALAAAAAAHAAGVAMTEVVEALTQVTRAERWRMEVLTREPITVINDAYNANPNSMAAALRTLAQIARPGQRTVAVLGQMSELGEQSVAEHDKLGELAVRLGVSQTVVIGRDARPLYLAAVAQGSWDNEATFAEDADDALEFLRGYLQPGDLVLVKSSNSAGLRFLGDRLGDYVKGTLA
ncbi:UDP-N-acetylmuramoyl-tripeptide--D-alanyl-D-alanine ligase [Gulosibacter molinativorax]|uniref:UDP-N-acetylmuramoyl-tripeptide--D-alanyl-D-alanine ligase n=1 Tax=Gulosibacter molinativorax TaxID=256821 RepID=A0ABT7C6J3_9MICO|nr:UDP-N-acetylmuramoyl-tripeptide--D-alanyl-D-alanine ligase [Gulosibacter molinativorax]MDJ1370394.1 UDP-N-acetylmuramoyl-tripeptide--D-alanyl-D-alanine ligase [Gulosibacter molinativorax]QUY61307.1 UDP-N-acetylmuramoyl-tripeptide--D-alanyl-D-alanine ligase [Gulosibacter molinativorax]